jgi:purine-binding chemotaxis protein CheW
MLGGEMFAIAILAIKEIIEYTVPTEVPMMPPYVRGVINLRGAVVPVADLSVRFGRKPSEVTRRTCIVIVEIASGHERQDVGLMVDAVSEVLEIPAADIGPPPAFGARIRAEVILGMGRINGKLVMLLDVNQMLTLADLAPPEQDAAAGVA